MNNKIKPIIFWEGFPACGLLLKKVIEDFGNDLIITATRPVVPFKGLGEMLDHNIVWFDNPNDIWKRRDEFADRNFIIHTGWRYKGWLKFDKFLKKKNKAKTVVVVDNRYRGNVRQWLGALWFRFHLKKFFDASFVPGREGQKLMKFLGMGNQRIYTGNYGAYEGVYFEKKRIQDRNKEFLFVGQLNKRKSVDVLLDAFKEYQKDGGTWSLRILGDGPLRDLCHGKGIIFEGFTQPNEVADKMNDSRVFILPSRDDNWGTVVCEAAACGMHLITTTKVGASVDIIRSNVNGRIIKNLNKETLKNVFFYYEKLNENMLINGSDVSKGIARGYDSNAYYAAIEAMIYDLFE